MAYTTSSDHQDMFQYPAYTGHGYHYISDNSTAGGEDTNFWSNSPTRSDSPPSNSSQIGGSYQIFSPVQCSNPNNRYTPYRTSYTETEVTNPITGSFVRVVKRRSTANKKERRRTMSINNAYYSLRECIPFVAKDTKLSKIKTLRLATSYISYLTRALETDDTAGGFKPELGSISRKSTSNPVKINDTTDQVSPKSDCSEDMGNSRRVKGRTGWPQHVWASELKQEH